MKTCDGKCGCLQGAPLIQDFYVKSLKERGIDRIIWKFEDKVMIEIKQKSLFLDPNQQLDILEEDITRYFGNIYNKRKSYRTKETQ